MSRWTRLWALVALPLAFILVTSVAWAYWSAQSAPGGNGAAAVATVDQGATPTVSATGTSVTVNWTPSTLSTGLAVTGYRVKRYDAGTETGHTPGASCGSTIAATTCTENSVPDGSWKYTVTPVFATNWSGAESAMSSTITIDTTAPTVTINQAAGQADPTTASPVNYTVVFSEPVTGFNGGDITFTGTAGANSANVSGSGSTYTVAISGMTQTGTVRPTIGAGRAQDLLDNGNAASTSTDNTVQYNDNTKPTVTINQAAGQVDPTNGSTVNFTAEFSEPVTGFTTGDVTLAGTAGGTKVGTVTGSGTSYNVAVTGATGNGTIIATIAVNKAADAAGNNNTASTSTDNTVTLDTTVPAVTINQAAGQADPTTAPPINYTVVFSEPVTGFTGADIAYTGTAGANAANVTGSGSTYTVAISGMTQTGTVRPTIGASSTQDLAGNNNTASTSTDNTVQYNDNNAPTVTINQAAGQPDPTTASPVNYTVVFSEPVTGFTGADITYTGTAGANAANVTGSGANYSVAISGMTQTGTVRPTIDASTAQDLSGNNNTASTSTDNTVQYNDNNAPTVTINQAAGQADPTNGNTVNYTVVFSEPVTGFATGDITFAGTAGGTKVGTVTGSGPTYNVAVTGATGNGTIIATVGANKAGDTSGNNNTASTSTDNTVTLDTTAPTVTLNQAAGQANPTNGSTVNYTVVVSEPVTGFATGDVTLAGTSGGTKVGTVSGSGTTYNVAVTGATGNGTIIASIDANRANDAAGNNNAASTSSDNTVTLDTTPPNVAITGFTSDTGRRVTVSGTAGTGSGDPSTVTVVVCTNNTYPCTGGSIKATLTATVNPTTGAWSQQSANIGANPTLYARATQTDSAGNIGTSTVAGPVST